MLQKKTGIFQISSASKQARGLHVVHPIINCYGRNVCNTVDRISYIFPLPLWNTKTRQSVINLYSYYETLLGTEVLCLRQQNYFLLQTCQSRHLSSTCAHVHSIVTNVIITCFLTKQHWSSVGEKCWRAGHTNPVPKTLFR